ncbi:MAG: GTPase [Candidatus Hydrogenedentes bacterium]|nr:GTPase [Candidatus Hydrogenedentota bacterium]
MQESEKDAVMAICLMAAVADGGKSDVERAKLKEVSQSLGIETSAAVMQRVLLGKTSPGAEAAAISTPEIKMLAFEMAVCICDADGMTTPKEAGFLAELRDALALPVEEALETQSQAEDFARAAFENETIPAAASAHALQTVQSTQPNPVDAEVDQTILKHAILVGGLELLPQSLSTMAILPLQMKLVYNIGTRYGYQLDSGHVKEFLAVLGVGMTSQIIEGFARKFLGSLARRAGGRMMGGLSGAATGAAVTFAATYGLGMAAKKYYASGRKISMADVKTIFAQNSEEAKGLYSRYAGQVEQSAKSTNVSSLLSMVRGG